MDPRRIRDPVRSSPRDLWHYSIPRSNRRFCFPTAFCRFFGIIIIIIIAGPLRGRSLLTASGRCLLAATLQVVSHESVHSKTMNVRSEGTHYQSTNEYYTNQSNATDHCSHSRLGSENTNSFQLSPLQNRTEPGSDSRARFKIENIIVLKLNLLFKLLLKNQSWYRLTNCLQNKHACAFRNLSGGILSLTC